MLNIKPLLSLLVIPSFSSCALNTSIENGYEMEARAYAAKSPVADAERDYKSNDYSIYSAMGIGLYYPGIDPYNGSRIAKRYGEKRLEGTTDAPETSAQRYLISVATGYAKAYNMRKYLLIRRGMH